MSVYVYKCIVIAVVVEGRLFVFSDWSTNFSLGRQHLFCTEWERERKTELMGFGLGHPRPGNRSAEETDKVFLLD